MCLMLSVVSELGRGRSTRSFRFTDSCNSHFLKLFSLR